MLTDTSALRRTAATLIAAGALTTGGLAPAAAHDEVMGTSPEQGAVLEVAPEQIELSFSGKIMDIGHQVLVTDSERRSVTDGPLERNGTTVSQPLTDTGSQDETYQVVWRVVSADGHPIEGTYTYDIGKGADTIASAPSAVQAQDAATKDRSGQVPVWAFGVAAVVLLLAVVGLVKTVSHRRES